MPPPTKKRKLLGAEALQGMEAPDVEAQPGASTVAVGDNVATETVLEENVEPSTSQGEVNMIYHVQLAIRKNNIRSKTLWNSGCYDRKLMVTLRTESRGKSDNPKAKGNEFIEQT
ncbi:hypothetical protein DPMN_182131 [Dreissena polymorpha]|uniref:Uncharacterized protein n=1 Tax=Dreissena polymorpha TaxID=45954 RepID=A0A9D4I5W5_DREPO|nr:hypothetical protein DPMN_182131 [Dreissena polymorpha]